MRILLGILMVLLIVIISNSILGTDKFQGMWRLVRYEVWEESSKKWLTDSTRIGNDGFLMYDAKSHVSVHLQPKEVREFDLSVQLDTLSVVELQRFALLYPRNFAYFGTYKINDSVIVHTKLSATNPKEVGSIVTRKFEFSEGGDTLVLAPSEKIDGKILRLIWKKQ